MTWPSTYIVDAIFIAVYVILALPTVYNVIKHGHGKAAGYIYLLVFCAVRIVGNVLLVYSYKKNFSNQDVFKWGFILQGIGYSFLLNSTLAFYSRAVTREGDEPMAPGFRNRQGGAGLIAGLLSGPPRAILHRILYLLTTVALVLLIIGYTNSDVFSASTAATSKLDSKARAGDTLFTAITIAIIALVLYRLVTFYGAGIDRKQGRIMLFIILLALPFMMIRSLYLTVTSYKTDPLNKDLAVKVVLQYVMEVIVVIIYSFLGYIADRYQYQSGLAPYSAQNAPNLEASPTIAPNKHEYPPRRFGVQDESMGY